VLESRYRDAIVERAMKTLGDFTTTERVTSSGRIIGFYSNTISKEGKQLNLC